MQFIPIMSNVYMHSLNIFYMITCFRGCSHQGES